MQRLGSSPAIGIGRLEFAVFAFLFVRLVMLFLTQARAIGDGLATRALLEGTTDKDIMSRMSQSLDFSIMKNRMRYVY